MAVYQVNKWIKQATDLLHASQVPSARLDALILLEDTLGKDRAWILAHPEFTIQDSILNGLKEKLERRANHEPLAYIRGKSEFYGREFYVTPATLQPRPETETIISLLKELDLSPNPTIVDVGTGSGAIAITCKLELPYTSVYATEIQADALKIAQKNATNLIADINFYQGNLLEPLPSSTFDTPTSIILANLPYVPTSHTINKSAMQEPEIAIFGGEDGLDVYRQLLEHIKSLKQKPTYILTESLPFQHKELVSIATQTGYKLITTEDLIQTFAVSS